DRLVAVLQEQEPAYRASVEADAVGTWQEVHRSLRHSVSSLLDPRGARDAARRCTWRIGAARAEQGLPLDALLHAFRLGGSLVWQGLVDETSRTAPEDVRLLVHVATDVWEFVDEHCTLVADAYRQTERQLAWRRENRVRLLAAALLDGSSRIADLPEAAAVLGLPEQGRYVVVAVAGGRPVGCPGAESLLPPAVRVHWHPGQDVDYGIVLADDDPEPVAADTQGPGLRIGVSSTVEGLAAVGGARELADRRPGPLAGLEPADADVLLETLATWLACDGSAQRASRLLYCHRNTVLNRLRRYEQLTGRSLSRPSDLVEVTLALTAHRLLPR